MCTHEAQTSIAEHGMLHHTIQKLLQISAYCKYSVKTCYHSCWKKTPLYDMYGSDKNIYRRRLSINSTSKCPLICFSGSGGIMTPANLKTKVIMSKCLKVNSAFANQAAYLLSLQVLIKPKEVRATPDNFGILGSYLQITTKDQYLIHHNN